MDGFNHFEQCSQQLYEALKQIVVKTAFDIQAQAAARAPVATGNLRLSIYAHTANGNQYPGGASMHLIADETTADEMSAGVGVAANYGLYVEFGTTRMPARPFLAPAADQVRGSFEAAISAIESQLG